MPGMPAVEIPTLTELCGEANPDSTTLILTIHRIDSLADVDRWLLCPELPARARTIAERHKAVLERLQATAGDNERLRVLLVEQAVSMRSGAVRLCRRLIEESN